MQIGTTNNQNEPAARAKAMERIELERQGKLSPHPVRFFILTLGLFILNFFAFNTEALRSIIESVITVAFIFTIEFGIYTYKNRG